MAHSEPWALDPDGTPTEAAALVIPARIAELLSWERFTGDPVHVAELHEMRIAAKRLRYTLEIFAPCYADGLAEHIRAVRDVQELLGAIHDADVLIPRLQAAAAERLSARPDAPAGASAPDLAAAAGLVRLCCHEREERTRLHGEFCALWQELRARGAFERLRHAVWAAAEPAAPVQGDNDET